MIPNINTLANYYADHLAFQYRGSPKARATIRLFAKQVLGDLLAQKVKEAFNLGTASGISLDYIGKYVGAPRESGILEDKNYFRFIDLGTETEPYVDEHGFTDLADDTVNADAVFYLLGFNEAKRTLLTDEVYRQVVALMITLNASDGSFQSVLDFVRKHFPGTVYAVDRANDLNMHLEYGISTLAPIAPAVLQNFLPRTAGLALTISYVDPAVSPQAVSILWPYVEGGTTSQTVESAQMVVAATGFTGATTCSWQLQRLTGLPPVMVVDADTNKMTLSLTGTNGQQMEGSGYVWAVVRGDVRVAGNYMYFTTRKIPYTITYGTVTPSEGSSVESFLWEDSTKVFYG